jgi:hypothetical protein
MEVLAAEFEEIFERWGPENGKPDRKLLLCKQQFGKNGFRSATKGTYHWILITPSTACFG